MAANRLTTVGIVAAICAIPVVNLMGCAAVGAVVAAASVYLEKYGLTTVPDNVN